MKAFFESLQIGAVDAWTLFVSLDKDGDHTISVDEFTERSMQLYGPAKSADLYALRQLTAAWSIEKRPMFKAFRGLLDGFEDVLGPKGRVFVARSSWGSTWSSSTNNSGARTPW